MTNPFDMFSKNLNMWTQATLSAQRSWMELATQYTEQMNHTADAAPLNPTSMMPNILPGMMMDETKVREVFQSAADMNLQAWTQMAEKVAALPSWVRWPVEVPGRSLADMFDMLRPFPVFENFDAPAETTRRAASTTDAAPDDLTAIKGIGPKMAEKLEAAGIVRFEQIAAWNQTDSDKTDTILSLGGRIARDNWVAQAKKLAKPVLH